MNTIDLMVWNAKATDGGFSDATGGAVVTGSQLLVQRWLITFLNKKGSTRYRYKPRDMPCGTDFMRAVAAGHLSTETALISAFVLAERDARQQLQAEERATDPPDECYVKATLKGVHISSGVATLNVQIYSKASSTTVQVPLVTAGA